MTPLWFWEQDWSLKGTWVFNLVEVSGRLTETKGVRFSMWCKDTREEL